MAVTGFQSVQHGLDKGLPQIFGRPDQLSLNTFSELSPSSKRKVDNGEIMGVKQEKNKDRNSVHKRCCHWESVQSFPYQEEDLEIPVPVKFTWFVKILKSLTDLIGSWHWDQPAHHCLWLLHNFGRYLFSWSYRIDLIKTFFKERNAHSFEWTNI